jgi:hypothetical protein
MGGGGGGGGGWSSTGGGDFLPSGGGGLTLPGFAAGGGLSQGASFSGGGDLPFLAGVGGMAGGGDLPFFAGGGDMAGDGDLPGLPLGGGGVVQGGGSFPLPARALTPGAGGMPTAPTCGSVFPRLRTCPVIQLQPNSPRSARASSSVFEDLGPQSSQYDRLWLLFPIHTALQCVYWLAGWHPLR